LSLEIAEKILKKELESDASQQKYINDLIKEVNNSKS
jgi:flagellar biosynthesis/type III secretory pathway protein FliH